MVSRRIPAFRKRLTSTSPSPVAGVSTPPRSRTAGQLVCIQRQAQRRLAQELHGRAIARVAFVGDDAVDFAAIGGDSHQVAAEEAVVHGLLRWALARFGRKRFHQPSRKRRLQSRLKSAEQSKRDKRFGARHRRSEFLKFLVAKFRPVGFIPLLKQSGAAADNPRIGHSHNEWRGPGANVGIEPRFSRVTIQPEFFRRAGFRRIEQETAHASARPALTLAGLKPKRTFRR